MRIKNGKENANSVEPQEKEILKKYLFPILHKQATNLALMKYESCHPKTSPDKNIVSKQNWEMDQASP